MLKIREFRQNLGISQKQLANCIGVTDAAISQYEKGKRKPDLEILKSLTKVFNCTLDDLTENKKEVNDTTTNQSVDFQTDKNCIKFVYK